MSHVFGDCLYVGIGASGRWGAGIRYHHSTCELNGRQAIAVVAGRRVLVEHVHFDGIGMNVLDIEPNSGRGGALRIVFRDNTVGTYGHSSMYRSFFFAANGSHRAPVRQLVVRDNVVTGGTLATLVGDEYTGYGGQRNRRRITFVGNRSTAVARWGPVLTFKHADGIRLWRNRQRVENGHLVSFIDCTGVRRRP